MKKLCVLASLVLVVLAVGLLPHQVFSAGTLADTINSVLSNTSWSGDPAVISVGTVFGKAGTSEFDSASVSAQYQWGWVRQIALEDGYSSQTIDGHLSSLPMAGALPATYQGNQWLVYDRYLIPLYDKLGWSKSAAITQIQGDLAANEGRPLLAFGTNGGWNFATRYYDEWMQDLDIVLKLGDTATAATLWDGVNAAPPDGNWNGQNYVYRADQSGTLEGEVGFFAAVAANYKMTVGSIPNFDRVSTDLYNKLLVSGWSSPLWGVPGVVKHATGNSELRPGMTAGAVEALQMYYTVSSSSYKSAWVSLLTGSTPAWQAYANSALFSGGYSDSFSNAQKALTLFMYGVIPDSGCLAVPTNEWHYEDWTSMMPSTLFKFDYAARTIRIPVYAGNIKFDFGSSIASYNFPSNGVYQVQFSSDWSSVASASSVGGLSQFHFLSGGGSSGSGSIQVSGQVSGGVTLPVSFEAWYDTSSHVTVPQSGTYTFTNVPSGSHTVYGLHNGIQKSSSVTVSQGQTASCTLDFSSSSNTERPVWWPAPLPWPLPGVLSTIVSSPIAMFGGVAISFVLIIGAATKLTQPKGKGKKDFSLSERK
jgi:hypothetical protein